MSDSEHQHDKKLETRSLDPTVNGPPRVKPAQPVVPPKPAEAPDKSQVKK